MALRVGFVGAGKLASALTRGLIKGKGVSCPSQINVSCPPSDASLLKFFEELGAKVTHSNLEVVENADIVVLAVKPDIVEKVAHEFRDRFEDKLYVSLAAGINLRRIEKALGQNARVVRVMPNIAASVMNSATVFCPGGNVAKDDVERVSKLFGAVGSCHQVQEKDLNAVTAVAASGLAFALIAIEAMADGAVLCGLPRSLSYSLASQTLTGSASLVQGTRQHPGQLKDDVCSPAGTTIAGVQELEQLGLRNALIQAVNASFQRCRQIEEASNKK